MKKEEQDKLWAELPEKKQKEYKERYNSYLSSVGDETHLTNHEWGIKEGEVKILIDMFGEHNLKPALTYEDVARELGTGDFKEFNNKLEAIGKLMAVAKFLNKNEDGSDWVPNFSDTSQNKWYLYIDYQSDKKGKIRIDWKNASQSALVYFRTREISQQAVQILGEEVVRTALTTVY